MAGYFAVSFSFGILAMQGGLSVIQAALTSLTNMTSSGQFAGLQIIAAGGTLIELILTQVIINMRYSLMSLALSPKLDKKIKLWQRLLIAFANTDEIFAVAMSRERSLTFPYMAGLQILPIFGWTAGTAIGAIAGNLLPTALTAALGIALYGMFIAVVVPVARRSRPVLLSALIAIAISCVLYVLKVSAGISIIVSTVAASALMAFLRPIEGGVEE
ncbi:MAG: AzlC family ABC transporter permease [Oscillospiraceae bacterium]|nr:AzlC family ABC transporter permease [Clostridiaceae bacterium]MDY5890025.1 AzlC family ABC transporter permease [Oscillospiraceae bacterium]MDY5933919.1 AzlC family ABC transporter permease [Oscillospiraceae bacterium]